MSEDHEVIVLPIGLLRELAERLHRGPDDPDFLAQQALAQSSADDGRRAENKKPAPRQRRRKRASS